MKTLVATAALSLAAAGSAGRRGLRRLPILIALAVVAWPTLAIDLPKGLSPLGAASVAGAPAAAASQPSADDWRARLARAREAQEQLNAQAAGSAPLLAERQQASSRLLALLAGQIDAADTHEADALPEASAPLRLAEKGPYGAADVDALRDRLDELKAERAALLLSLKSLDGEVEAAIATRNSAGAALNLRRDQAGRPLGGNEAEAQAQLELASLQAQIAGLEVLRIDSLRQRSQARLAALDEPTVQVEREFARVRGDQALDEATLKRRLKEIESESAAVGNELARLEQRITQRSNKVLTPGSTRGRELDALNGAAAALRDLQGLLRREATVWRGRFDYLASDKSLATRRGLVGPLDKALQSVAAEERKVADQHALLRIELRARPAGRGAAASDDAARADDARLQEALRLKLEALQRLEQALRTQDVMLTRLREDLALDERPQDVSGWLSHGLDATLLTLRDIWQKELFSATESTVVDGRMVTVEYGVTVGKSIGLLLVLIAGYWGAGVLSRHAVNLLARRLQLSPAFALVIRRWLSTILVLVVILIVLRLARIPLTAFAFMGGALAIGIGFGTQTIIKNLISGVIILLERKIHVGDVVTVGGMAGTVVTVDFRATTVRGFDGIDAIVPNSQLLENQISNWSGGGPSVRRVVSVGVAYGCDVRAAADRVLACARGHASVLAVPSPEVLLADFAADALSLRLQYWTRMGGERAGATVDSDLRFAIEQALREAGIAIAFPQRDVHLDLAAPVRVQMVGTAAQSPPPETG